MPQSPRPGGPRRQASSSARLIAQPRILAVPGERMLERGEQGDRRDALDHQARGEQESAGRRLIERRARGIVDLDAPAAQLGGDPARELPIAGDQRARCGVLERRAHAQRGAPSAGRSGCARAPAPAAPPAAAASCAARPRSWPQAAWLRRAARAPDRCRAMPGAIGDRARSTPALEQLLQAVLRMGGREHAPARLVHVLVEAGQHHGAAGQGAITRSRHASRDAAGRAGSRRSAAAGGRGHCAASSVSRRCRRPRGRALSSARSRGQASAITASTSRLRSSARPGGPAPGWRALSATRSVCSSSRSAPAPRPGAAHGSSASPSARTAARAAAVGAAAGSPQAKRPRARSRPAPRRHRLAEWLDPRQQQRLAGRAAQQRLRAGGRRAGSATGSERRRARAARLRPRPAAQPPAPRRTAPRGMVATPGMPSSTMKRSRRAIVNSR